MSSICPNVYLGCKWLIVTSADKTCRKCCWMYGWEKGARILKEALRMCVDICIFLTFPWPYYLILLHGNMGTQSKIRDQEQRCPSLLSWKNQHQKLQAFPQFINSQGNYLLTIPSISKQINKRYRDLICLISILRKLECRLSIVVWWLRTIQSYKQSMTIDDNVVSYIINAEHPFSPKTNSLEYFKPITNRFNADHCKTMCVSLFLMFYTKASQKLFVFYALYSFMLPILLTILVFWFEKSRFNLFQATLDACSSWNYRRWFIK